ncbi:hypothetical protein BGZ95_001072 [Linnemannia exigua]|uniref:Inner kinetochore subunit AME1 domain-containing protein n=1 Tax=Linnemannia exigua TaxID=604196 RepID=A0AAD4DJ54_9FUNG|nr:hypothetical protein BGZ95_001072 [Linnemannia exigua]
MEQKYKDKVQARKRGAGTHQPKFRGFSLGKTSSKDTAADHDDNIDKPGNTAIVSSSSSSKGSKNRKPDTSSTSSSSAVVKTRTEVQSATTVQTRATRSTLIKTTTTDGLTERYQERLKTRFRGAGAHKSDFKGFSLKDIKSKSTEKADHSGRSARDSGSESTEKEATSLPASASAIPPIPRTSNSRRATANHQNSTPSLKDMLAQPSTTIPLTPNSTRTRAGSRYTGQSPSFKLAWGKTLVLSETKRQEAAQARVNEATTPTVPAAPAAAAKAATPATPVEDFTGPDDFGDVDNFDAGDMPPSSPIPDTPEPRLAQETSRAKRKSPSTIIPNTTAAATTATRKPTLVLTKRRRLIQEEVDENDEPLLPPKESTTGPIIKSTTKAKENARDRHAKSLTAATKAPDMTTDAILEESSARKSGQAEGRISTTSSTASIPAPKPTTKPTKTTIDSKKLGFGMPLTQTKLMHLNSKPGEKETDGRSTSLAARSRVVADDDSGDDSDFIKPTAQKPKSKSTTTSTAASRQSSAKKASSKKGKGLSYNTVQNYKQLQIHCLKFWGPAATVAKPATVRNKDIAERIPSEGEDGKEAPIAKKTVQSILHIENAPLSEMDVIAEAVRDVVDNYIDSVEDQSMVKELLSLRAELETRLIEQVDMLDDHSLLKASVKKAAAVKKELRVQLLETQRRRQRTRQELARVRAGFEREERARRRLEETHKFLTDLESLRDEVVGSDEDGDSEGDQTDSSSHDNVKTGLQSYIATVGARSGGVGPQDGTDTRPGMLGALVEFNRLLETMVKNTPSTTATTAAALANISGTDSDSDYDL